MKKIIKLGCILFVCIGLFGCVSSGHHALKNETEKTIKGKITEGVTTKADIKRLIGSPTTTSFTEGGSEIWKYEYISATSDAVNYIPFMGLLGSSTTGVKKELTILFKNDVVKKYSMSESDFSSKTGIFK